MADVETEMAHVRSLPSDYVDVQDRAYDGDYISNISKQMQVPDRICLDDGSGAAEDNSFYDPGSGRQFSAMNVPDRIVLAGDNQHIGLREGLRRLPLERDMASETPATGLELASPPRVLTMEQRFPVVEDDERASRSSQDRQVFSNGHVAAPVPYTPGMNPNDSLLLNEEDEATLLRTQVAKLTRRMAIVEQDGTRRSQREMGLYVALFGYAIWKFVFSFFSRR